jgi:hypothetical protein
MQDKALRVGEQLVIQGYICLTILDVEEDEVVLGITTDPNGVHSRVDCQLRPPLATVPPPLPSDN